MMDSLIFLDSEIGADGALLEVAALKNRDVFWKGTTTQGLAEFVQNATFLVGHNLIHHDLVFLIPHCPALKALTPIDTLYLSPLLFPQWPYHRLVKDDKLYATEINNPLNDCYHCQALFEDEIDAFRAKNASLWSPRGRAAEKHEYWCTNSLICVSSKTTEMSNSLCSPLRVRPQWSLDNAYAN